MMRHVFLRNYRMEEDFDTEHTRRNLQNMHQDKALAESQRPLECRRRSEPECGLYA